MTKGMKSSEFYLAVATVICIVLSDVVGIDLNPGTIVAAVSPIIGYILSRGMAKTETK
ncbi:hypothetical protein LCGC14_1915140 [marine sediment metagenome]|uniref:Uncharacterized protein n=1 Tax=marine sediment metagenome TaxID=412755 RepID=A0A0F9I6G5_9ZZZZ